VYIEAPRKLAIIGYSWLSKRLNWKLHSQKEYFVRKDLGTTPPLEKIARRAANRLVTECRVSAYDLCESK
jgi:hypothetical protein